MNTAKNPVEVAIGFAFVAPAGIVSGMFSGNSVTLI